MKECLACHSQVEDPRHTCPHCGGSAFWQGGSGPDALPVLDAMLKQAEAAQHVDRGAQFIMQGRYAEAERELKEAIRINPLNATAHSNMGAIFDRQGRPEEAIPWLEEALKLNPYLEGVSQALARVRAAARERPPAQAVLADTPELPLAESVLASAPQQPPAEVVPALPLDTAAAIPGPGPEPTCNSGDSPLPAAPARTSTLAIISLVAGIAGILVPLFGALVAIITGRRAKKQIRQEPQRLSGSGLASAGLVLGYGQLALIAFIAVALVVVAGLRHEGGTGHVPTPKAGHWEGEPDISFDVTQDGRILNFKMAVPFQTGTCNIHLEEFERGQDGLFMLGDLIDTSEWTQYIVGSFAGAAVFDGTYLFKFCGGSSGNLVTSGFNSDAEETTWSARWTGPAQVSESPAATPTATFMQRPLASTATAMPRLPAATATPYPTAATATPAPVALTLQEALDQGVVEAQIQGTGATSGASITLTVRRLVPRDLWIAVDPGTVLVNSTSSEQDMVVRRLLGLQIDEQHHQPTEAISLVIDDPQTYVLEAYCLDMHKDTPVAGASFSLGGSPSPAVSAILATVDRMPGAGEDIAAIQAAIWAAGETVTWTELAARGYAPEQEMVRSILRMAGLDPDLVSAASWQELTDLPRNINALIADPVNPGVIYAGTGEFNSGSGVFKSEDAGLTWRRMSAGLPSNDVRALAARNSQPSILYAISGDTGRELYASTDGAKSWAHIGRYESSGFRARLDVAPTAGNLLFVAEDLDGVFRSRDGGRTWRQASTGLPQQHEDGRAYVASLVIDPTDANAVYVGTGWGPHGGNGVFKSIDGGETWAPVNQGMLDYTISALAIDPVEPQTIYAASYGYYDGTLFKSTDGGQSWEDLSPGLSRLKYTRSTIVDIVIDPSQPRTIYALDVREGVLVSHDAGATWDLLGKPDEPDQPTFTAMAVLFGPDPAVVVGTEGDGGWRYGTSQPAPAATPTMEAAAASGLAPTSPTVALPTATRTATRPTRTPAPPLANCPNPVARITSPANGAAISGIVPFIGTAAVDNLLYYKVEYKPASSPTWQFLTQVEGQAVTNGKLIDFYTSTIAPGVYDFRLIVVDKSGNYPPPCEIRLTVKR